MKNDAILTYNYNHDEFSSLLDIHTSEMYELKMDYIVDDDYYKVENYGSMNEDGLKATEHAKFLLNLFVEENDKTIFKDLTIDLDNIIKYADYEKDDNTFNLIIRIIKTLAEYDIDNRTTNILRDALLYRIDAFVNDDINYHTDKLFDLCEVFMLIGDRCLFIKGDLQVATSWYDLICILDPIVDVMMLDQKIKDTIEKADLAVRISKNNLYITDLFRIGIEKKTVNEYLEIYFGDRLPIQERILKINNIINVMSLSKKNINESRNKLIFVHKLIDNNLKGAILFYSNDRYKYADNIISKLLNCSNEKLFKLCLYVQVYKENDARELIDFIYAYIKIENYANEIIKELRVENNVGKIGYYTKLDTFMKMLPCQCNDNKKMIGKISCMNISYMNDPTEGVLLEKYLLKKPLNTEDERTNAKYPGVYMKCFTDKIDDLPMWEMYGDKSKGCCIVIDYDKLDGITKQSMPLYSVCYVKVHEGDITIKNLNKGRRERVKSILKNIKNNLNTIEKTEYILAVLQNIDNIKYLFKDSDYIHENETRIVFFKFYNDFDIKFTKEEWPKLFVQPDVIIPINEIILGPKFEDSYTKIPFIESQLAKMPSSFCEGIPVITFSSIKYK